MKHILLLIAFAIAASTCRAQYSDTAKVSITLEARYHAYIIAFMPKDGDIEKQRYIFQVAHTLAVTTDSVAHVDSAQMITVRVKQSLVPSLYETISNQQERLTSEYNHDIKYLLFVQLQSYPALLAKIIGISNRNAGELKMIVNSGFDYLRALK